VISKDNLEELFQIKLESQAILGKTCKLFSNGKFIYLVSQFGDEEYVIQ
jgi:hypothetical protein